MCFGVKYNLYMSV